ncbi:hypothetical protein IWQ60_010102 [Tieghemiomyces parasiticus]|uniref:Uncharacterized protein n=1 Tax=Tieghemiomyces parasiticus TaxID=78921 RepID=A0A9W7ZTY8_9FUNG|nr:hypothetical protein IWQ60_010102 [Tieghemiomyces parasiticus]
MVRTMTNASTEKLQCYVVVIALLSNGFHFIVDDLATELRIPTVKLGQICKSTGCQVIVTTAARDVDADTTKKGKTSSVRKAILTAPIEFPKERQLPKRARQ